jgi:hypothetical protein
VADLEPPESRRADEHSPSPGAEEGDVGFEKAVFVECVHLVSRCDGTAEGKVLLQECPHVRPEKVIDRDDKVSVSFLPLPAGGFGHAAGRAR